VDDRRTRVVWACVLCGLLLVTWAVVCALMGWRGLAREAGLVFGIGLAAGLWRYLTRVGRGPT